MKRGRATFGDVIPWGCLLRRYLTQAQDLCVEDPEADTEFRTEHGMRVLRSAEVNTSRQVMAAFPPAGTPTGLAYGASDIRPGTSAGQRVGRYVRVLGIQYSYYWSMSMEQDVQITEVPTGLFNGNVQGNGGTQLRVMIVVDRQPTDTVPAVDEILNRDLITGQSNNEQLKRFKIIFDRRVSMNSVSKPTVNEAHYIDCDFFMRYGDDEANLLPVENAIYVVKFGQTLLNADLNQVEDFHLYYHNHTYHIK